MWDAWREFGPVAIDGLFDEFFFAWAVRVQVYHPFYIYYVFYILLDIGLR